MNFPSSRNEFFSPAYFGIRRWLRVAGVRPACITLFLAIFAWMLLARFSVQEFEDAIAEGYGQARGWVVANTQLELKLGEVSGLARATRTQVANALNLPRVGSPIEFDTIEARRLVVRLPWIRDAEVRYHFPGRISAIILEEIPVAVWREGNSFWLLNIQGQPIEQVKKESVPTDLLVLVGRGAGLAIADIGLLRAAHSAFADPSTIYYRVGGRRWNVALAEGPVVQFPEKGLFAALERFHSTSLSVELFAGNIVAVDLRDPDVVQLRLSGDELHRLLDRAHSKPEAQGA